MTCQVESEDMGSWSRAGLEYLEERGQGLLLFIPHHEGQRVSPSQKFDISQKQALLPSMLQEYQSRGKKREMVAAEAGTGRYSTI